MRKRLGDDAALFGALLLRLLDEFVDLAIPAREMLAQHQQRLHKLRGSAGILGAKAIWQDAGEAEAACAAGAFTRVAELTAVLVQALATLRGDVDRVFPAQPATASTPVAAGSGTSDEPSEPCRPLQSDELATLLDALRHQSLSALTHFEGLSGRLQDCLGQARYASLRVHLDNLHFAEAVNVLETAVAQER